MRILVFSDFHDSLDLLSLKDTLQQHPSPDIVLTLGDISCSDLRFLRGMFATISFYGLRGNHDGSDTLLRAGVPDLHGKVIEHYGVRIAGLEGSSKYKYGNHVMYSQKESLTIAKNLPPANILVSHDRAFHGLVPNLFSELTKTPHEGLCGLSYYNRRHHPFLHIHGHIHKNKHYSHYGIETVCVYGAAIVTVSQNSVQHFDVIFSPG